MLPRIREVEHVEMIRDGGSLWAMYVAHDGFSYTLGFPIEIRDRERIGYQLPFFGKRIPIERDGIRVGHRHEGLVELPWAEAKVLLDAMRDFVDRKDAFQSERFEQMHFVADHSGHLPPGISRDFR